MWCKHENNTSLQKLDWRQKRTWSRKSDNCRYQQRCRRSRSSYKFQGTEEDELSDSLKVWTVQSTEFTCPRHRHKFWQMRLSHHYVPVYAERMRRETCQKWRRELLRNTTEASKGPEVPLRNTWDHKYSDFEQSMGNPDQKCKCETFIQSHQRVAIGRTRN